MLDKILDRTLYMLPTIEIGLKSANLCELLTLGIRAIKMLLIPLDKFWLRSNSVMKCLKSSLKSAQKSLLKPKLFLSGFGLLKLSQYTVYLTSSRLKGLIKFPLCKKI